MIHHGHVNIGGRPCAPEYDPSTKYQTVNDYEHNTISVKSGFDHVANVEISANEGSTVKVQFEIQTKALAKTDILRKCEEVAAKHNLLDVFHKSMANFDNGDGFGFIFGLIDILSEPVYQNASTNEDNGSNNSKQTGNKNTGQESGHRYPFGMMPGQALIIPIRPEEPVERPVERPVMPIYKPTESYDLRHDIINSENSWQCQELANEFASLTNQVIRVTGESTVEGVSEELSRAKIFVKIATIRGKDKNGNPVDLKMISPESGELQDLHGNKKNDVKLNIVQL